MRLGASFWISVMMLVALAAVLGLRHGLRAAAITETDVITTYAAIYVEEEGGQEDDCLAFPASDLPGVWLVVRCKPSVGATISYHVGRLGGLVRRVATLTPRGT